MTHKRFVIGCDPGKINFAVAIIDKNKRLVHAQMFKNTIQSMAANKAHQRGLFFDDMQRLILGWNPKTVICEEFQARGFATHLSEIVNIMIGMTLAICHHHRFDEVAVTASTWKNNFNKRWSLDRLYAYAKKRKVPPHIVDAMCLAIYCSNGRTFEHISSKLLSHNVESAARCLVPAKKPKLVRSKNAVPARRRRGRTKLLKK